MAYRKTQTNSPLTTAATGQKGCCANCVYWNDYDKTNATYAQCRAAPPIFVPAFKKGSFPETNSTDWCGWWRERNN